MKKIEFALIVVLVSFSILSFSQVNNAKIQAVFTYNYTKLVLWPDAYRTGDFVIGVIGNGNIVNELENMAKTKKVGSQNIVVKNYGSVENISKCHILVITASQSGKISAAVAKSSQYATLVITENNGGIDKGSCINFVVADGKQKFEVSEANASKRGLKISNDLVKLAIR
ncbi:MAG: hypothetical protein A2X12_09150 [Bacteroidetes bacterium GWE2_29_8]|nr:MAG: hypothetical protein A2X12_09150 [Bacteroidetes bacterium GWE2_29_8]OFY20542.1 MAG: hypothetical protein A2X02_06210 [Bacteroidetes bacterium GWF2_29_10]